MRRLLTVYDEGYLMWNILVDEDQVDEIADLIKRSHDEFYNDYDLQDKYGGYSEYVDEVLIKIDEIEILEGDVLEL